MLNYCQCEDSSSELQLVNSINTTTCQTRTYLGHAFHCSEEFTEGRIYGIILRDVKTFQLTPQREQHRRRQFPDHAALNLI